ncbi:MAG: MGMT family protein, partial [Cyclobacteriaceae bacterium]
MAYSNSSFFEDVYEVVKLIPKGRATSYGAIARYLGTGLSARMVGWAMHAAPAGVPAHRVLNSQGMLSGKHAFKAAKTMENRLKKEGVKVDLTSALFGVESKKHRILFKNAVFHFGWVLKSGFYLCFCVYPKTQCKQ